MNSFSHVNYQTFDSAAHMSAVVYICCSVWRDTREREVFTEVMYCVYKHHIHASQCGPLHYFHLSAAPVSFKYGLGAHFVFQNNHSYLKIKKNIGCK